MDSTTTPEIVADFAPYFYIYSDGTVKQLIDSGFAPPTFDTNTNVESKDALFSPEDNLSLRLYLPKSTPLDTKLPIVLYFHGGGFCIESAFSNIYHGFCNIFASRSNAIVASVEYRQAPTHPLPFPQNDSWAALKWVASHIHGNGPDDWLNRHADLNRVYLAGDSAGGNIAHHMGVRHGLERLDGVNISGIILFYPFFWGEEALDGESSYQSVRRSMENLRLFTSPDTTGFDEPMMNPAFDTNLAKQGTKRVLVFVAENDFLRARGLYYAELLKKSGWDGDVEVMEFKEVGHCFHLENLRSEKSMALIEKCVHFINHVQD